MIPDAGFATNSQTDYQTVIRSGPTLLARQNKSWVSKTWVKIAVALKS